MINDVESQKVVDTKKFQNQDLKKPSPAEAKTQEQVACLRKWIFITVFVTSLLLTSGAVLALVFLLLGDHNISTSTNNAAAAAADKKDCSKSSWPELVGLSGDEAKVIIEQENLCLNQIVIVSKGSVITTDYQGDRVRVWVDPDNNNRVFRTPWVGR